MVLELRPAHDVRKAYGFVGVVTSTADLSASVWLWERADDGTVSARKVITIPAEPADADRLPEILKPFGAVPPLVTDISLSVDDRWLLVSCWGTGELKRYDVSDPRNPRETGSVHLGGIVRRAPHPGHGGALNGGPQMVETSRDGKRIFLTNSLYAAWDAQFYPEGIDGWLVKLDAGEDGSLTVDPEVFVTYSGERPHQVRLAGGDASSDSYCFPD
jgi:selenium-binding protein 1